MLELLMTCLCLVFADVAEITNQEDDDDDSDYGNSDDDFSDIGK